MTRRLFGGDNSVVDTAGNALVGVSGQAYDSESGGTLLTDLLDTSLNALTGGTIVTSTNGKYRFYGPDAVDQVWVDFGYGRFLESDTGLAARVATLEASLQGVATALTQIAGFELRMETVEALLPLQQAVAQLAGQVSGTLVPAYYNFTTSSWPSVRPATTQPVIWIGPDNAKMTFVSQGGLAIDGLDLTLGFY